MKRLVIVGWCAALLACGTGLRADEAPGLPAPGRERAWLKQLAGEWDSEGEAFILPGQPPIQTKTKESARMVGGSWVVIEGEGLFMDTPFSSVFTLGYDPEGKKFVGTWIDSVSSHLWHYEGTLDAGGTSLTLETLGPCIRTPGRPARYTQVIELKDQDHRTYTSRAEIDGKWETMVTTRSRRKP